MKRSYSILIAAVMLSGCGAPPLPDEYALPDNAKVGLYVAADKYPKHTHFGTKSTTRDEGIDEEIVEGIVEELVEGAFEVVFGEADDDEVGENIKENFVKKYEYDWDITNSIYDIFKSKIEYNTSLQVINLKSLDVDPSRLDLVGTDLLGNKWEYNEKNELLRLRLLEQGIYAFVYISDGKTKVFEITECAKHDSVTDGDRVTLKCVEYDTQHFYSDGYGLFSTTLDSGEYDSDSVSYYASASFDYAIEVIQPPIDLVELDDFRNIRHFS